MSLVPTSHARDTATITYTPLQDESALKGRHVFWSVSVLLLLLLRVCFHRPILHLGGSLQQAELW